MTGIQLPAAIFFIFLRGLRATRRLNRGRRMTHDFLFIARKLYFEKADVYQNQQPVPSSVISDIVKITLKENF